MSEVAPYRVTVGNVELVFTEPPASGWGAPGGEYDEFFRALLQYPGQWVELPPRANGAHPGHERREWSMPTARRRQGYQSATRKIADGTRKTWVMYTPPLPDTAA